MSEKQKPEKPKAKVVVLEDLEEGADVSGFMLTGGQVSASPSQGISTYRIGSTYQVMRTNPVASDTVMCGW